LSLASISSIVTRLEKLAMDKHYSLLRKTVNYGFEKFYDTGPWSDVSITANITGACATKVFTDVNVAYSKQPEYLSMTAKSRCRLGMMSVFVLVIIMVSLC
jgi:hypothetical protein